VHGCFWHACGICQLPKPRANAEFWHDKLEANARRDAAVERELADLGWTVKVVWEHELRADLAAVVQRIRTDLAS
jgi:DNA mismatch endonuclease, patch repair protein